MARRDPGQQACACSAVHLDKPERPTAADFDPRAAAKEERKARKLKVRPAVRDLRYH